MLEHQPYDHALKSLMGDRAAEIIPQFLPQAELVSVENIEIKRELLRADLVYLIQYKGKAHILNLELQTNADSEMVYRILLYHIELHLEYRLPVISIVLYLFEANVPEPPFRELSGDEEEILTLHYRVLALWTMDAREYVKKRIIGMYTFLPGMKGANAALLLQAIEDMNQRYPRPLFVRHLRRFKKILQRSGTVSVQDKQIVEAKMHEHYDSFVDEDPEVQERVARGKIQIAQKMVVGLVEVRFPSLTELAQEKVTLIRNTDTLDQLAKQVATVPDENTASWLLNTFAA
jgi:ribosomal protein S21